MNDSTAWIIGCFVMVPLWVIVGSLDLLNGASPIFAGVVSGFWLALGILLIGQQYKYHKKSFIGGK
jgi:hypothetical protein